MLQGRSVVVVGLGVVVVVVVVVLVVVELVVIRGLRVASGLLVGRVRGRLLGRLPEVGLLLGGCVSLGGVFLGSFLGCTSLGGCDSDTIQGRRVVLSFTDQTFQLGALVVRSLPRPRPRSGRDCKLLGLARE